jgi:hypothetical protein
MPQNAYVKQVYGMGVSLKYGKCTTCSDSEDQRLEWSLFLNTTGKVHYGRLHILTGNPSVPSAPGGPAAPALPYIQRSTYEYIPHQRIMGIGNLS